MRILGLAGSLRAQSIHREILRAMVRVVPSGMTIDVDDRIRALPLFNPDQEMAEILAVEAFRAALREADGVIIACPEYAHGVPGAFKNALD
jgi:NAD(P)H-dependent FMN reductase